MSNPPVFYRSDLPIYIPCFNNYTYLKGMIEQLQRVACNNIVVVDNASTYPPMLAYLEAIATQVTVVRLPENRGPRHLFLDDAFYQLLPPYFCITDPDLAFNPELPADFMQQLLDLSDILKIGKVGFSLDISQPETMRQDHFLIGGREYKIWEWEAQFWQHLLAPDIYGAPIDTTFAVYNKRYFDRQHYLHAVRIGGCFTCRHLPWYQETGLPPEEEAFYRQASRHSFYLQSSAICE